MPLRGSHHALATECNSTLNQVAWSSLLPIPPIPTELLALRLTGWRVPGATVAALTAGNAGVLPSGGGAPTSKAEKERQRKARKKQRKAAALESALQAALAALDTHGVRWVITI